MGNFKTENVELSQIHADIITNYGNDVKSKFVIGDALVRAKEISNYNESEEAKKKTEYDS